MPRRVPRVGLGTLHAATGDPLPPPHSGLGAYDTAVSMDANGTIMGECGAGGRGRGHPGVPG